MKNLIELKKILWCELMLFLTWYGVVMVWINNMYYRSLRSRVMFKKLLWKENLNIIKIQKKYYNLKLNDELFNIIYLKSINQIIDYGEQFNFINESKDLKYYVEDIEYFKNFEGFLFIYDFEYKRNKQKAYSTLVFFYNYKDKISKCYILNDKIDNIFIEKIMELYLEDNNNLIKLEEPYFVFVKKMIPEINKRKFIYIYKDEKGLSLSSYFNNKKSFLKFLKSNKKIQKKFQKKDSYKKEIWLKLKSEKELSKIDLQKEIEKSNKKIDLEFFLMHEKHFKKFEGFIIIFIFETPNIENEFLIGVFFYNYYNRFMSSTDCVLYIFGSDDINSLIFFLNLYYKDYNTKDHEVIGQKNWIGILRKLLMKILNKELSDSNKDKKIPLNFWKFKNFNDFLKNFEKKIKNFF